MFPGLCPEYGYRVFVQRYASWCSILGLVEPSGLALQIHPVPFQAEDFPARRPVAREGREMEVG